MVAARRACPSVQRAVGDFFGKPPMNNLNPDE